LFIVSGQIGMRESRKVQEEEVCSGLLDHVRGKRRLKGERGLKVMVGLWLLAFDGVGSGDEERLQFKK